MPFSLPEKNAGLSIGRMTYQNVLYVGMEVVNGLAMLDEGLENISMVRTGVANARARVPAGALDFRPQQNDNVAIDRQLSIPFSRSIP